MADAPAIIPAGYLHIGDFEFGKGTRARCIVTAKPKSVLKIDKKEADGKNDAVITNKGRKVAEWEFDLKWNGRDTDADTAIEENLYQLSPRGPNSGKSWQFTSKRARVHGTTDIEIEEVEGPNDTPGTDECTAKIKACSWAKPAATGTAAAQGAADTPTDGSKWTGGHTGVTPGTTVKGFGGNDNTITFGKGAPSVKP